MGQHISPLCKDTMYLSTMYLSWLTQWSLCWLVLAHQRCIGPLREGSLWGQFCCWYIVPSHKSHFYGHVWTWRMSYREVCLYKILAIIMDLIPVFRSDRCVKHHHFLCLEICSQQVHTKLLKNVLMSSLYVLFIIHRETCCEICMKCIFRTEEFLCQPFSSGTG